MATIGLRSAVIARLEFAGHFVLRIGREPSRARLLWKLRPTAGMLRSLSNREHSLDPIGEGVMSTEDR